MTNHPATACDSKVYTACGAYDLNRVLLQPSMQLYARTGRSSPSVSNAWNQARPGMPAGSGSGPGRASDAVFGRDSCCASCAYGSAQKCGALESRMYSQTLNAMCSLCWMAFLPLAPLRVLTIVDPPQVIAPSGCTGCTAHVVHPLTRAGVSADCGRSRPQSAGSGAQAAALVAAALQLSLHLPSFLRNARNICADSSIQHVLPGSCSFAWILLQSHTRCGCAHLVTCWC